MANAPTQSTLRALGIPDAAYYSAAIRYIEKYCYQIEDRPPERDGKLLEKFEGPAAEYYRAVKIRNSATAQGKDPNRHFIKDNIERPNYAVLDYAQRLQKIETEARHIAGVLIEWKEVRLADDCVQKLRKIQISTNATQHLVEGEIERRQPLPRKGAQENLEIPIRIKYGRRLINAENCPCAKRACITPKLFGKAEYGKCRSEDQRAKSTRNPSMG